MNSLVRDSVKTLLNVEKERKFVDNYARDKFDEKFSTLEDKGGWIGYDHFQILSETMIRIHYLYGGGDMEFNDSFDVEI